VYLAEFIVRPAARDDFQAIRSLIHTVHINPIGLEWERFLVVVTPQGKFIGCGQIKPHSDGSREMSSIAVQEKFQSQGVARRIIEALLTLEQKRPIFLMCRARLKLLYMKFGFHAIMLEEMPPYFRRISRAERIFNIKAQPNDRLLVMCLY
jgi:N-acetylglutamate synthase-like GNAT family acetyltransferase